MLRGEGLESDEADEQRERLLDGFRWILVDEYQDVDDEQYQLISALAGWTLTGGERKLTLFAVGDDDQNIYAYAGASVKYLRRFEEDYKANTVYLTQNYRSTGHIIAAANAWIASAHERMKSEHPIAIDRSRRRKPKGGDWESRDAVGRGRVQILRVRGDDRSQSIAALAELVLLAPARGPKTARLARYACRRLGHGRDAPDLARRAAGGGLVGRVDGSPRRLPG